MIPKSQNTILVVEDEPNTRYLVTSLLADEGYRVLTAADGAQAVAEAKEHAPDLVLLDWMLPDQTGEQVARTIREHRPDQRIVVLTADGRAPEKARLVGAIGYPTKPFEVTELLEIVAEALSEPEPA